MTTSIIILIIFVVVMIIDMVIRASGSLTLKHTSWKKQSKLERTRLYLTLLL